MSLSLTELLSSLLEMDEIGQWSDGVNVYYEFLTTGFSPELVKIKARILSVLSLPPKPQEVVDVQELEKGIILSRYKVVLKGPKVIV